MKEAIVSAIENRKLMKLWYHPGERLIEPHAFGVGSENQFLLRAFQVNGASASNEHVNWKLFRIDRVNRIEVADQGFIGPRPGYKMNDKAMPKAMICQLKK